MQTLDTVEELELEGMTELVSTARPTPYDYAAALVLLGLTAPILGAFAGWAVLTFRWAAGL